MVNWSEFCMGQYRDDDHRENAPRFILPLKIRLSNEYGEKNFISIVVDRSTALIEAVILGTDKASHRDSVTGLEGSYEHIWSCYSRQKPISIGV